MLLASPSVYLGLQDTFRDGSLICISHDNNAASIEERSCGNVLQAMTREYEAIENE